MAINMGMGALAGPNIGFKRKFRWTLQIDWNGSTISPYLVKIASRPNVSIEETEINFLNGKMWIPGKASWETITVTFYDLFGPGSDITTLYSWLASVYNFLDPVGLQQMSRKGPQGGTGKGYSGAGILTLYDGCGTELEIWDLDNMWPQAINFGELDFSTSEEVTIEATLRYSEVTYTNLCGSKDPYSICSGCTSGGGSGGRSGAGTGTGGGPIGSFPPGLGGNSVA